VALPVQRDETVNVNRHAAVGTVLMDQFCVFNDELAV
jgi:hypothetical protein